MGFPGYDTQSWPALGEKVAATYHDGVVSRLTDFQFSASAPAAELQYVQYTMATWGGLSGSPVFLSSGRVGAVHNSARTVKSQNGEVRSIAHGIRSDSVLELLVYHKLDRDVPFPIDKSKVALDRWTKPDERGDEARVLYAKATALVNESKYLWTKKEYQEAKEKCDAALKLVPNHADAYYNRANAIHSIYVDNYRMPKEQALQLLKLAYTDAIKCGQLRPRIR